MKNATFFFNGFSVTVYADKVVATQKGVTFTFSSVDSMMEAIGEV